jgi:hypothetical protein
VQKITMIDWVVFALQRELGGGLEMKLKEINESEMPALNYAEGWLSGGYGGTFLAGWNGARFNKAKGLARLILALKVKKSLDERGLKKGFNLKDLRT